MALPQVSLILHRPVEGKPLKTTCLKPVGSGLK